MQQSGCKMEFHFTFGVIAIISDISNLYSKFLMVFLACYQTIGTYYKGMQPRCPKKYTAVSSCKNVCKSGNWVQEKDRWSRDLKLCGDDVKE